MRLESLSKNVVEVMKALSMNQGIARLLIYDEDDNPLGKHLPDIENTHNLIRPSHKMCKISPYPFDVESKVENGAFIRVYYNFGEFDSSEVIAELTLNIDIVVSKDLWLIENGEIRPYEIMARVINTVGKRSLGKTIKVKIDGFQHLAVNTSFDAIRLTSDYATVESSYER